MKNEDRMDEVNICCIVTLTRLRCSPGEHYTVDHQMIASIKRTPAPWQQTKAVLTIPLHMTSISQTEGMFFQEFSKII